jgi:triosephosphate isomerase
MKQKFYIAGNWKMNHGVDQSLEYIKKLDSRVTPNPEVEIILFPPFTSLAVMKDISSKIQIGSQNIYHQDSGAFTGEISPLILKDLVKYVLVGHSERREIFKETDSELNLKLKAALNHRLTPILCVGESLRERENNQTEGKIKTQLTKDLDGIDQNELKNLLIAYEPIWAIGTGKTATPEQAQEVHALIREFLDTHYNITFQIPLLYGGSVKPANCQELLEQQDINGVLVGGASLQVDSFFDIIDQSCKLS